MALVRAFERSDRSIMYRVHAAFEMGLGNVARVGACALVALIKDRTLHVANGTSSQLQLPKIRKEI
jgi:hypothetical protein